MIREITTKSSVWTFDMEAMTYIRKSRVEGAEHPYVGYVEAAQPFEGFSSEPEVGASFVVYLPGFEWIRGGRVEEIREVEVA